MEKLPKRPARKAMRTRILKLEAEFDSAYEQLVLVRNRMEAGSLRGVMKDIAAVLHRLEEGICVLGDIRAPLFKMIEGCVEVEIRPARAVPPEEDPPPVFPPGWWWQ
jgi:hypothetical protein